MRDTYDSRLIRVIAVLLVAIPALLLLALATLARAQQPLAAGVPFWRAFLESGLVVFALLGAVFLVAWLFRRLRS
jgi:sterol desaturase/sphingolipid hydroxylase (fatty acid hydroxylase superfamily)